MTISPSEWAEKIASTANCSESSSNGEWDGGRIDLPPLCVVDRGGYWLGRPARELNPLLVDPCLWRAGNVGSGMRVL
jgi:hypothetical protein